MVTARMMMGVTGILGAMLYHNLKIFKSQSISHLKYWNILKSW